MQTPRPRSSLEMILPLLDGYCGPKGREIGEKCRVFPEKAPEEVLRAIRARRRYRADALMWGQLSREGADVRQIAAKIRRAQAIADNERFVQQEAEIVR